MTTALGRSDVLAPFSDCSIAYLLPRTLGSSLSAGETVLESEDQDIVTSLFKSAALKNTTNLLENAKMVSNRSCSSIQNPSPEEENTISLKQTKEIQIELQGKRARQRRPGLPGTERGENFFNFSAKVAAVEASQIGASHLSKRRSSSTESDSLVDSQSWPVIDYNCLENITDPTEYFSTFRMLENAEKELKRLKGDTSPRLSQPQGRRERQRRPGLSSFEGKKNVFKFPSIFPTVEASPKNSSLSNITEVITTCSKEICQTENLDSVADNEIDELDRLLSKCRELDNDEFGISNIVRDTLQINPIHLEKPRGFPFSVTSEHKLERHLVSPITKGNKVDGLSILKARLSVINQLHNPLFLLNCDGEVQRDGFKEVGSSGKVFCDGTENISCNKRVKENTELENLKSDFNDVRADEISKSGEEILKSDLKSACIPLISNKKGLIFVDEVHSPVAEILEADKNVYNGRTSDPKGNQFSLLEKNICQMSGGVVCDKKLLSYALFEYSGQASPSVNLGASNCSSNPSSDVLNLPSGNTISTEQTLYPDLSTDQCLPENPTVMDEEMDEQNNNLNGMNKNQRHSEASGGCRRRNLKKKEPRSRKNNQTQTLRRQSLKDCGTVWETGVRRSTRIRVKPLQYWCGERLLYGRVHDNLPTVIGVKKFGTPQTGKKAAMKVESYVTEQYADLVALAALH